MFRVFLGGGYGPRFLAYKWYNDICKYKAPVLGGPGSPVRCGLWRCDCV